MLDMMDSQLSSAGILSDKNKGEDDDESLSNLEDDDDPLANNEFLRKKEAPLLSQASKRKTRQLKVTEE
jgi:hypothetical protein